MAVIILPVDQIQPLENCLTEVGKQLNHHPLEKVDLKPLMDLMDKIKAENKRIQEAKTAGYSFWTTRHGIRTYKALTGLGILASAVTCLAGVLYYYRDHDFTKECIVELQPYFNSTRAVAELCDKNPNMEWAIVIISVICTGTMFVSGWAGLKYQNANQKQEKIIDKISNQETSDKFYQLLIAMSEFIKTRDADHFDTCIKRIADLRSQNNYFLSKICPPEIMVSYLIAQYKDKDLNQLLEDALKHSRPPGTLQPKERTSREPVRHPIHHRRSKHRLRKGEGAGSANIRTFASLWTDIQNFLGIQLDYLRFNDNYISKEGFASTSETDVINRRGSTSSDSTEFNVVLDLNEQPNATVDTIAAE